MWGKCYDKGRIKVKTSMLLKIGIDYDFDLVTDGGN